MGRPRLCRSRPVQVMEHYVAAGQSPGSAALLAAAATSPAVRPSVRPRRWLDTRYSSNVRWPRLVSGAPPSSRSAVQNMVEAEPEQPEPDVLRGQVRQSAVGCGSGQEKV